MAVSSQSGPPLEYSPSYEWPGSDSGSVSAPPTIYPEYDTSYEWVGEEPTQGSTPDATTSGSLSFLRLVVQESACLPSKRRLAILTGFPEVQIGRDKPPASSVTPRIRLKEMEVSKFHATIYWDASKDEWGIVDMGSMHGTFVHTRDNLSPQADTRLSPPRIASLPRYLHHEDLVSIGSTTFAVHIHHDDLSCEDCCSSDISREIPVFSTDERSKPQQTPSSAPPPMQMSANPKKSLAMLKSTLLRQHSGPSGPSSMYMDRSARRREVHGHSGAPGVASHPVPPAASRPGPSPKPVNKEVVSDPPTPLATSNVGHRLLSQMGWAPGSGLGVASDGEVEPIRVNHHEHRAGLGTKRAAEGDWEGQKRYTRR